MMRAGLVLLLGLSCALAGCHKSAPDPVPPAPSGGLAAAPPGALGAHAAGLRAEGGAAVAPPLAEPPDDDLSPPEAGDSGSAPPPDMAPAPPGSGVAL